MGSAGVDSWLDCLRSYWKVPLFGGKSLWVYYFQGILTGKRTHHCQHVRSGLCCMLRLLCAPPLIGMFNLQTQHTNEERSCLLPASVCAL